MRNFFQAIVLLVVFTIVGVALFVYFTDKKVIVLNDGNLKTVDQTWLSGDSLFYEIDSQIDFLDKSQIKTYGKRQMRHVFMGIKGAVVSQLDRVEDGINPFFKKKRIPVELHLTNPIGLLALFLFLLIMVRLRRLAGPISRVKSDQRKLKLSATANQEPPTRLDIVRFFLILFKHQIGAEPDAPSEFVPLISKTPGLNHIYELRVKHAADWVKRRMTIGPLGEDTGSRSTCYYVIYDVHMVVKIPVRPINDFEDYIGSIQKEVHIVNKLIPKKCIIPRVSVILSLIHTLPYAQDTPAERLEKRYIDWLRKSSEYQKYLKINDTFVFFMDLSKYYFLNHILDELHDIRNMTIREITENAPVIWDPAKFRGRYGTEPEAILEMRDIFNRCEVNVHRLMEKAGLASPASAYQVQKWFYTHLAAKQVAANGGGYPDKFIHALNRLLDRLMQANPKVIDSYRKTIKNYVYRSSFEQNKIQIAAITANLLDMLAWVGEKKVSMRDLKPDNLFVAGDPVKYPLFLKSARDFSIGIIDVETAVDLENYGEDKISQPLLGGTPYYATPSHFVKNEVLSRKFDCLGDILHLQDWHATLVMIYKTITGNLLFEQTARLFGEIRGLMVEANRSDRRRSDVFEEASRIFWHSAFSEFQVKLRESEKTLKSVRLDLPNIVKRMFENVLSKEKKSIVRAIQDCVISQRIFESQRTRSLLVKCSYARTCRFKADLEKRAGTAGRLSRPGSEAIAFLHKLADLKALFGQHAYATKLLSQPQTRLSAYDILTLMFNVVYHNMYRSQWAPLFGEAVIACDMPHAETIIEADC